MTTFYFFALFWHTCWPFGPGLICSVWKSIKDGITRTKHEKKREIPSGRGFLQDSFVRATPWAYLCKLSEYCTTVDVKNTFFFFNCFGMLFLISLAVLFASVALLHFFPNPNQVWQLTSQFRSLLLGPIFLLLSWRVSDQSDTCLRWLGTLLDSRKMGPK